MQEYQPATSAFQTSVLPDEISAIVLSGGRTIPFRYYLGSNSTVPLVRLESPTTSKELTWGDAVELPPGSVVSVRNISYGRGDIQIQSGPIPSPAPRRVTIPVDLTFYDRATDSYATPTFPCDTRRARRAYITWGIPNTAFVLFQADITILGFCQQHSGSKQAGIPVYIDTYHFDGMFPDTIPLGTSLEGNGMRLLDYARVLVQVQYTASSGGAKDHKSVGIQDIFYVVEY